MLSWQHSTKRRFWLQFLVYSILAVIVHHLIKYVTQFFVDKSVLYVVRLEIISASIVVFVIFLYTLSEYWNFIQLNARYTYAELERFKKENAEFKLETLMNQVNPHFLFNSLNTLSSLVFENQEIAAKYIRELSKVYRYVLENKNNELVSLKEELNLVNAYKYLLELRFQGMIRFEIDVNEEFQQLKIAPMTIQMLIENAVKHNVVSKRKELIIIISANDTSIEVSNNIQLKPQKEYSTGLGLTNIKSRYGFFTKREIEVDSNEVSFKVRIPLLK